MRTEEKQLGIDVRWTRRKFPSAFTLTPATLSFGKHRRAMRHSKTLALLQVGWVVERMNIQHHNLGFSEPKNILLVRVSFSWCFALNLCHKKTIKRKLKGSGRMCLGGGCRWQRTKISHVASMEWERAKSRRAKGVFPFATVVCVGNPWQVSARKKRKLKLAWDQNSLQRRIRLLNCQITLVILAVDRSLQDSEFPGLPEDV